MTTKTEKKRTINFLEHNKSFCLSLHYNKTNSYMFVYSAESYKFKPTNSEIKTPPLCPGNQNKEHNNNIKYSDLLREYSLLKWNLLVVAHYSHHNC